MKWQNEMPFVHFSLDFATFFGCYDSSGAYLNRRETNVHLCKFENYVHAHKHTQIPKSYTDTRHTMFNVLWIRLSLWRKLWNGRKCTNLEIRHSQVSKGLLSVSMHHETIIIGFTFFKCTKSNLSNNNHGWLVMGRELKKRQTEADTNKT